jgi:very-short-patch-repair endonuclease
MRREPTPAEEVLWDKLRRNRMNVKFRRQHPIGSYIPDFYCFAGRLAIELDGSQHGSEGAVEYDEARSDFLAAIGNRVLRFSNDQVLDNADAVLARIYEALEESRSARELSP